MIARFDCILTVVDEEDSASPKFVTSSHAVACE